MSKYPSSNYRRSNEPYSPSAYPSQDTRGNYLRVANAPRQSVQEILRSNRFGASKPSKRTNQPSNLQENNSNTRNQTFFQTSTPNPRRAVETQSVLHSIDLEDIPRMQPHVPHRNQSKKSKLQFTQSC